MIKVIGQDYDAAWGHLESIYETRDLLLTLLRETSLDRDNARSCDLVHLVR